MMKLKGKTALITGCNRGIGKAILELFAKEGADIIACTRKETEEQLHFYNKIQDEYGVSIMPCYFDMGSIDDVNHGIKQIVALKRKVNVLVNNAGKAIFPSISRIRHDDLQEIFQINYFGPILLIKGLLMQLAKAGGASIINIASTAGIDGDVGNVAYGASKGALITGSKSLSKELASLRIRVNCIAPGFVETDMQQEIDGKLADSKLCGSALKRIGCASEVAQTALFLASDDSSYITGQTIRVDGGL